MPGKHLTIADFDARAEALEEAANHLDLHWTDDARERASGEVIARKLRAEAVRLRERAANERARLRRLDAGVRAGARTSGD